MDAYSFSIEFALVGALVGLSVGLTGIGAGSIMTPALTGLLGSPPALAVAHALASAALAKTVGVAVHGWRANVRWRALKPMLLGAVPAALAALLWLRYHSADPALNAFVRPAIGWAVLLTVVLLLVRPRVLGWARQRRVGIALRAPVRQGLLFAAGMVIGPLVMISSVGAGVIGATALVLLNPDMEPAEVAGTDLAFALPLAALGAIGYALLGMISLTLLATLLLGYVPAIAFASAVARRMPQQPLNHLLSALLAAAAVRMIA